MADPNFAKLLTKKYGALDDPNRRQQAQRPKKKSAGRRFVEMVAGKADKGIDTATKAGVDAAGDLIRKLGSYVNKQSAKGKKFGSLVQRNAGTTDRMKLTPYRRGSVKNPKNKYYNTGIGDENELVRLLDKLSAAELTGDIRARRKSLGKYRRGN